MIKFLICLFFFTWKPLNAAEIEVIGPCSPAPVYAHLFTANFSLSLGKNTVIVFDALNVNYVGNEIGMHSILNTPVGNEAIEILSETSMRAYGWCFTINGAIPDELAGQVKLSSQNDKIAWFFAFSTYESGKWLDYCVPSFTVRSQQFCQKD